MMNRRYDRRRAWGRGIFLLLSLGLLAGAEAADDWYSIRLAGRKVGYLRESSKRVARDGGTQVETQSESRIVLSRLGQGVEMASSSLTHETEDGRLLDVLAELRFSELPVKTEARVGDGRIIVKSSAGPGAFEREIPFRGELLGPEGIRRAAREGLRRPGDKVTVRSFMAELSQVVEVTQTVVGVERIRTAGGELLESLRVTESYSVQPQKRTVWLDRQGRTLKSMDPSPFGELSVSLTDRADALALSTGGIPDEQFRATLARSNVRLPQARLIDGLTLQLDLLRAEPGFAWPDLDGPGQRVVRRNGTSLVLRTEKPAGVPAAAKTAGGGADLSSFLRSNEYLNADDGLVRSTAARIAAGESDPLRRALLLEDWVGGNMKFDLGIAFAPSSEVMRNLRGTCAEYAILLAAMLRSVGIPSRFLMGYVYLNGIWGGHAWVEAFIRGAWIGLDAAVNGPGTADAARFWLARSSLDEGLGGLLAGGQFLFGKIRITVREFSWGGASVKTGPWTPVFLVLGRRYVNPGLGLSLVRPPGFAFRDLEAVWPERTLLTMTGPGGARFQLLQDMWRPSEGLKMDEQAFRLLEELIPAGRRGSVSILGRPCPLVSARGGEAAAAAYPDGVDLWLFLAQGEKAGDLLKPVLRTFTLRRPAGRMK